MSELATATPPARALPVWARLAAVPIVVVALLAGLWLFAGRVGPGYYGSIAFGIGWLVFASVALGLIGRRVPSLKLPLRATFLVTAIAVDGAFAWTTLRDVTVDEQVAIGTPASQVAAAPAGPSGNVELSRGSFSPRAHEASGSAAVVRLENGDLRLAITDLDTDNGPDLRVLLVAGPANGDGDVDDHLDLGALKGNKGDQQYAVPPGTDLARYATVVIWCRAFTVSFARAPLVAS